jgi:ribosomal protein S18 acetylase RimI-like enzyme
VPRRAARAEELGPFVLFVRTGQGWPYYARPRRGASGTPRSDDVRKVRDRQRELGLPEAFEWIDDVSPSVRGASAEGGLQVGDHPLMVHDDGRAASGRRTRDDLDVRLVTEDDDLALLFSVAAVGFSNPGTAVGQVGVAELRAAAAARPSAEAAFQRERLRSGSTVLAVAFVDGAPVASGVHQPVGAVTEVAGVATLPAFRRRGLGAAVTAYLVADARRRGIETVFLTAGSDEIARMYSTLGFRRAGTSCIAGPAD